MEEKIQMILLKECKKSLRTNDVPIGAVLVYNNQIIASSHNTREKHNNILGHAEVNCILKATKKLKTWNLEGCKLYVSLKPCSMCESIIKSSRISSIYYYLDKQKTKKEYNKSKFMLVSNGFSTESKEMLQNFFETRRK